MPQYTLEESFVRDQAKPGPVLNADLTGKTVIVIGANTGLGFETAKHLATMNPARLVLGCRSKERGEAALQRKDSFLLFPRRSSTVTGLVETTQYTRAELWLIDLANFASVKAFADKVTDELDRVDILIENAAVATFKYSVTVDGWENT